MSDIEKNRPPLSDSSDRSDKQSEAAENKTTEQSQEEIDQARERIIREHRTELEQQGEGLVQQEIPILPLTQFFGKKDFDIDAIATQPSVYDSPAAAAYFKPHDSYEHRHRWTLRTSVVATFRKPTHDFLPDLGMDTNVYQISFLFAELPSQMISKKLGPDRWIPFIMCSWSLVSGAQFFLSGQRAAVQVGNVLRPKGWFNEREEKILVNRILRDDPSKCDMHNRQAINLKMFWHSLCDYELWPIYIFGLLWEIPAGPPDQYLTLTLRNLGFGTFDANLLSIPCQFIGAVMIWSMCAIRDCHILAILSVSTCHARRMGKPKLQFCAHSGCICSPLQVCQLSRVEPPLARVIYSNIYREDDRPEYRRGNRVLVAIACMNICVYIVAKGFYIYKNRSREKKWQAMTEDVR
ncbi:conserved hypothetical protein [Verticillium alfalfae VaMs.102]|uniref:Phthalate transporter n=1 Tax=Verticillium alfalfae (strain VaMs.102 / ATCC MYA-4576 / FGSC 10136) TaxID=526221 RepID=C9SMS2_VERA1|nr:conserved hypothetical protein [Verticillium alfalfae VaMs.102]EEY20087.1 conserved hypothetical protein [Verticillium alfalfae VaMs.102]